MSPSLRRLRFPSFVPRCAAALIALAALATPLSSDAASATLDRIRSTGTIELAYRDASEPFSFRDREGRVRGYSVELCERVVESIRGSLSLPALKVNWRPVDAATRLDAVANGTVDIECGTTTMTLGRMERVDFSLPIYVDGGSVLVRAGSKIGKAADLGGKRVAVIGGTTTERALQASVPKAATVVPIKDVAEGVDLLIAQKVDGVAGDRIVLTRLRQRAAKPASLNFIRQDISYEPYALVVRRDDPDFRLAVNRALVATYRSGDIDVIFQRWFASLGRAGPLLHAMFYLQQLPE
jgi:glutamate/aspartate transport system substrate-binding protein